MGTLTARAIIQKSNFVLAAWYAIIELILDIFIIMHGALLSRF